MEMVLKYEVFPRGENIVTKCPLRFETTNAPEAAAEIVWRGDTRVLDSQAGILEAVRRIMESLGGAQMVHIYGSPAFDTD